MAKAARKRTRKQASKSERRLELDTWDIALLKEDPLNAKLHTDFQISTVAKSIEEFGFNDPIGVRPDGQIVEGHGRRLEL